MPGPTHRGTWKARERQAATLFGAKRQRCSGSSGLEHETRSDSTHPRLFIEGKLRASSPVHRLFGPIGARAKAEGAIPVVALECEGHSGFLVVVRSSDLAELAALQASADPLSDRIARGFVSQQDATTSRRSRRNAASRPATLLPGFGPPDSTPTGDEPY